MDKYPEKIVDVNEEAKENEKEQSQNFVEDIRCEIKMVVLFFVS